jgi:hypothetical protein
MSTLFADSGALFSECRTWRYHLWRTWDRSRPRFVVIGLNPSTADETRNDPTIRRCIGFAQRVGCGSLHMVNLFGYRSTDPKGLLDVGDPVGPDNDETIRLVAAAGLGPLPTVVAAWGTHGKLRDRDRAVVAAVPNLLCFGTNADGTPKHPLYLPNSAPLVVYRGRP